MKLAIVDVSNFEDYPIGGQLTSTKSILNYFVQNDSIIEILLIGIGNHMNQQKEIRINGQSIPFLNIYMDVNDPNHPKKSLRLHFMLGLFKKYFEIRKAKVDVFFIQNPESFLPLNILFPKAKIVVFSHGSFYNIFDHIRYKRFKTNFVKILLEHYIKNMLKRANIIFVLDQQSQDEYKPFNNNVIKVTNSIDLEKYRSVLEVNARAAKAVYIGRLSANKRVDVIIQALANLENMTLDIYGIGEEYANIEQMIGKLGVQDRVNLQGSCPNDEIITRLSEYDVLIMNSIVEGMPMVILEAMAAGLAILSTPAGAIKEFVVEGENGFFTDGSPESIIEGLKKLQTSDIVKIKQNNLRKAKDFDYRNVNEFLLRRIVELK